MYVERLLLAEALWLSHKLDSPNQSQFHDAEDDPS